MSFSANRENPFREFQIPSKAGDAFVSNSAFSLNASLLWKRRQSSKDINGRQVCTPRRRIGVLVVSGRPTRKGTVDRIGFADPTIQESVGERFSRAAASLLHQIPETQRNGKAHQNNNLVSSLTSSPVLLEYSPDELQFTAPTSAPPVVMKTVFLWPSPKRTSPGAAEFSYEWPNDSVKNSPSRTYHQADQRRTASGDGGTATENCTTWPRMPPHHLSPLEFSSSNFEKESGHRAAAGSSRKKTKSRITKPTEMAFSEDICPEKQENGTTGATIVEQKIPPRETNPSDGGEEKMDFSERIHQSRKKSRPTETSKTLPTAVQGEFKGRAITRSSSMRETSSSAEFLASKNAHASDSTRNSAKKSRAPRRSKSCRHVASSSPKESTGQNSELVSNGCVENQSIPGRVTNGRKVSTYDRSGRAQSAPISPDLQQAAGLAREERHVADTLPQSRSQPDVSSSNNQAYPRVRRQGVCSGAESAVSKNDRMHSRVMMKRFGNLDVSK